MLRQDQDLLQNQELLAKSWSQTKQAGFIARVDSPIERAKGSTKAANAHTQLCRDMAEDKEEEARCCWYATAGTHVLQ